MELIISEFMDSASVATLQGKCRTLYDPALVDDRRALLDALANAKALIVRNRTRVDTELLDSAPGLGVVGRLGVGLDNIDVAACAARNIVVVPATGANSIAVAEYVVATALILMRRAYLSSAQVAAGNWPRADLSKGREISGKTLGLIGFGGIGQLTARLASGLGMAVVAYDAAIADTAAVWNESNAAPLSFDGVLEQADVVSLHVPLTDQTRHLIDRAALSRMKKDAVLINTSRGGIVDDAAVAEALRHGRLGGAGIDVFEEEPLSAANPFTDAPNIILTPHIAGVTVESNERVSRMIAEKVLHWLNRNGSR